ncbi:TIM barrel protein [Flexithrix dorotheae]|uniref:TIM barrel protein n=1 Tax=Flexithrix dorotheae TaxID=70993 RepID=UPI000365C541|nr:TIM barrel protein [Flexithrix dorotheae]
MKKQLSRRTFLNYSAAAVGTVPFINPVNVFGNKSKETQPMEIHLFSKHLQFLDYKDMADAAAEMGFAGLDLTVRPKGHVEPERVEEDLPKAVEAIKKAGLKTVLMTTAITDAKVPVNRKVLETAAKQGFKCYRTGWLKYPKDKEIPGAVEEFKVMMKDLGKLNKEVGIVGAYQNHSGLYVGAAIWEIWEILEKANEEYLGCQYDIRHASVEGGKSWPTGLRLIRPRIKTIILKDYKWVKENGKWKLINTPLGEGMVDFISYFKLLKEYKINLPVSLHLEYDLGGANHGKREISISKEEVFKAMRKDLKTARELWEKA